MKRSQKVLLSLIALAVGVIVYHVGYASGYTTASAEVYVKGYETGVIETTKAVLGEMKRSVESSEHAKFDLPRPR